MFRSFLKNIVFVSTLAGLTLIPFGAKAQVASTPALIHYQAHLTDTNGVNIDGNVAVEIWIYDSPDAGVEGDLNSEHLLYAESHNSIKVDRGTLRLSIGEGNALGRFSGAPLPLEKLAQISDIYVEIYINDEKIEPRQRVAYQNYSLRAQYALLADSLSGELSLSASNLPENIDASKVSGTLPLERIPNMGISKITGKLNTGRIPSLALNKINSGNLNNGRIENINGGDISTGEFVDGVIPTSVMRKSQIYAHAGDVVDGRYIEIPHGFIIDQCSLHVGAKSFTYPSGRDADGLRVNHSISHGSYLVTCKAIDYANGGLEHPCTASYLIVCEQ